MALHLGESWGFGQGYTEGDQEELGLLGYTVGVKVRFSYAQRQKWDRPIICYCV